MTLEKIRFRFLTEDEFDARHPTVSEPEESQFRFSGEVQIPGIQGWLPASIFRGVPDMYFRGDSWIQLPKNVEFVIEKKSTYSV